MQTVHQIKENVQGYLLIKSVFEFDFEKVEKSDVEWWV